MRSYFKESLYVLTVLKTNMENSDEFYNIGEDACDVTLPQGENKQQKKKKQKQKRFSRLFSHLTKLHSIWGILFKQEKIEWTYITSYEPFSLPSLPCVLYV